MRNCILSLLYKNVYIFGWRVFFPLFILTMLQCSTEIFSSYICCSIRRVIYINSHPQAKVYIMVKLKSNKNRRRRKRKSSEMSANSMYKKRLPEECLCVREKPRNGRKSFLFSLTCFYRIHILHVFLFFLKKKYSLHFPLIFSF